MADELWQRESDPAKRRELKIELVAVALIAVLPDLINALLAPYFTNFPRSVFLESVGSFDRSLRVGAAVLFMMWRSGYPWSEFGLTRVRLRDPFFGVALWFLAMCSLYLVPSGGFGFNFGFTALPQDAEPFTRPVGAADWTLISGVAIGNGFVEEIAMRGLLISRVARLWGSPIAAVFVSAIVSGAYHIYGGVGHLVDATIVGLVFGIVFAATKRLWPVIFAHMLGDILPFVIW